VLTDGLIDADQAVRKAARVRMEWEYLANRTDNANLGRKAG